MAYDRFKAVRYAIKWWNKTNPAFYNYDAIGGDCTNFISQCLYAGGCPMDYTKTFGWYYINANNKAPAWTGVDFFYKFALSGRGFKARQVYDLKFLRLGDVIQLCQNDYFNHTLIITKISPTVNRTMSDIFVTAHSFNVLNKPLALYYPKELRLLQIL